MTEYVFKDQILALFGIDDKEFDNMLELKLNEFQVRHGNGYKYPIGDTVRWIIAYTAEQRILESGKDINLPFQNKRFERNRAQRYSIKVANIMKDLININEATEAIDEMVQIFEKIIEEIVYLLSEELSHKSQDDILIISDKIIRQILLSYSKQGEDNVEIE